MKRFLNATAAAALLVSASAASAADINLPNQLVTTAYDTGTSG